MNLHERMKQYEAVSQTYLMKETTAIVQSGNSIAAVRKFMFHVYPELPHDDMEKLPSSVIDGKKISNYRFHSVDGSFTVSAEKINLTSDFILIDQHFKRDN